jgi:protein O-GlcNAc transferase
MSRQIRDHYHRICRKFPANTGVCLQKREVFSMNQLSGSPATQIGRNDLCACGSGKKFKHCCLRATLAPATPSAERLMQQALALHEAGQQREAQTIYAEILDRDPDHADALHYSGLAAHQAGKTGQAISLMTRALKRNPAKIDFYLNLGQVLESNGAFEDAIALYRQAIALDAGSEAAHYRLGLALYASKQYVEAARSFSQGMSLDPASHKGASALGNTLRDLGRLEQATVCYRQAIALSPAFLEPHNNLGTVLQKLGRFDDAIACYREALLHHPDSAGVLANLGSSLRSRGDLREAVESCHRAIALDPGFLAAHINLANAYKDLGQLQKAVASYRNAIALDPGKALAHINIGDTLVEQGRLEEAVASYQTAIDLGSENNVAYSNLLYLYSFACNVPPAAEVAAARGWEAALLSADERAAARARASARSGSFPATPLAGRKLRLGIVSAELGFHAVAVFLLPFLENLDRRRVHLTLFPTVHRNDKRNQHFRALADSYIPLTGVPDPLAAAQIRAQHIDILIDTTGHTSDCRLGIFAHRAAPVQCSYIGYWSTTGLTEMDWYITDNNYSAGCDDHFLEGLWKLPHVAHCYKGDDALPASAWTPAPDGTIWLGSLNKYAKIREQTLALWAKVLHALPHARLLLEDRTPDEDDTHQRILAELQIHGVAGDRVVFLPQVPGRDFAHHMALYDRLDIALDTWPFNSGTTAFDALWMGVPLVALEGNRVCGRMASSIVTMLGRPDWVAHTEDEYVAIVAALAHDVEQRKQLRQTLRATMRSSELCDGPGLARSLQAAFEAMYDRWLTAE